MELAGPGVSRPTATTSSTANAGFPDGDFQAVFNLPEADVRPLRGERGVLAESFDEELLLRVDDRIVDGGPAKIDSGNYFHDWFSK